MNPLHLTLAILAFLVAGIHFSEWSSGMPASEFIWAWAVAGPVVLGLEAIAHALRSRGSTGGNQ